MTTEFVSLQDESATGHSGCTELSLGRRNSSFMRRQHTHHVIIFSYKYMSPEIFSQDIHNLYLCSFLTRLESTYILTRWHNGRAFLGGTRKNKGIIQSSDALYHSISSTDMREMMSSMRYKCRVCDHFLFWSSSHWTEGSSIDYIYTSPAVVLHGPPVQPVVFSYESHNAYFEGGTTMGGLRGGK